MIISKYTGQTILRYYQEEQEAVAFINFITTCRAQDIFQSA
jgi:ABC-type molybdate transport system substrate-binding protein